MVRRSALAVLADCVSDRLQMAGESVYPVFEPSTTLRFESGARVQLDGVPPDQLEGLRQMVASGAVCLKSVSARSLTFSASDVDCSIAAQMFSVAWDPFRAEG